MIKKRPEGILRLRARSGCRRAACAPRRAGALILVLLADVFCAAAPGAAADFLIPGVSMRSVSFDVGSSVEYMVISEAYHVLDTAMVSLSVPASFEGGWVLEIVSAPYPPVEDETVTVRLEMLDGAVLAGSSEKFRSFIRKVLVKEGGNDFREPEEREIDEFDLEKIFLEEREGMEKRTLPDERTETPAGGFDCRVMEFSRSDTLRVKLGGVDAERFEAERSTLWLSGKVPFWGLVRSAVERRGWTKLASAKGAGVPRPKVTVIESILVSYTPASR